MFLVRAVIAQQLLVATSPVYFETQQKVLDEQMATVTKAMSSRIGEIVQMTQEKQHQINEAACSQIRKDGSKPGVHGCAWHERTRVETEYNRETAVCNITTTKWNREGCHCGAGCPWKETKTETLVVLPTVNRNDMRGSNGGSVKGALTEQSDVEKLLDK